MNDVRIRDLATSVVFLLAGLVAVFLLIPLGVAVPGTVEVAALSPDFWPLVIGYVAIAASAFLLVESLFMQQPQLEDAEDDEKEYKYATIPSLLRILALVAALFAFYASLDYLGVVAASVILIFVLMLFFGERRYWLVAVLSLCIPVVLYIFFRYAASVPMPLGYFGTLGG